MSELDPIIIKYIGTRRGGVKGECTLDLYWL